MKILQLEIENLASLKGKHALDFTQTPLAGCGLFLISGPTGSGKSTLLDAISLALFNELPRLGKVSNSTLNQTGGLVTRHMSEAYARLTYEASSGTFTSEWRISKNRNGNWKEYEFQVYDASGRSKGLKRSEVANFNVQQIGLDYEQFTRSVVLAQGEFAQLLKSKEDERAALLERITGTRIYRQLGRAAFDRSKALKAQDAEIQQQQAGLRLTVLDDERVAELEASMASNQAELIALEDELKQLESKLAIKQSLEAESAELARRENELKTASEASEAWELQHRHRMEQHRALLPIEGSILNHAKFQGVLRDDESKLQGVQFELTSIGDALNSALDKARKLTGKDASEEEAHHEMQRMASDVRKAETLVQNQLNAIQSLKEEIQRLASQQALFNWHPEWSHSEAEMEWSRSLNLEMSRLEAAQRQWNELGATGLDAQSIRVWETKAEEWVAASKLFENALQRAASLNARKESLEPELLRISQQQAGFKSAFDLAQSQMERARSEWELHTLRAALADHRTALRDGEECPLCGSVEHPFTQDISPAAPDVKRVELDRAELALKEASKNLHVADNQWTSLNAQLRSAAEELAGLNVDEMESTVKELQRFFPEDWSSIAPVDVRNRLREWRDASRWVEEATHRINGLHAGKDVLVRWSRKEVQLTQDRAALARIWPLSDSVDHVLAHWTKAWQEARSRQQVLRSKAADLLENIQHARKQIAIETEATSDALAALGIPDLEAARAKLLKAGEAQLLSDERQGLELALTQAKGAVSHQQGVIVQLRMKDTDESRESIEARAAISRNQQLAARQLRDELRSEWSLHQGAIQGIAQLEDQRKTLLGDGQKWLQLNDLIGDSEGKRFNKFAQQLTLHQLLAIANRRLNGLTDRYRFADSDESGNLVVIDEHMGGERRGVATLSGGETFLLSLGLALGLSDLASRNIHIGELFIDEGFGTLDPESLEGVLEVLDRLQAEGGRNVGIISHVAGLKERVSTQVLLTPTGQGHSRLDVISLD